MLGHTFPFYSQDEAEQFVKYLRKNGVSSRIESVSESSFRFLVSGTYDNLVSYFTYCQKELQDELEAEKSREADNEQEDPDDEAVHNWISEIEEELQQVEEILSQLALDRSNTLLCLEGKSVGDIVFERQPDRVLNKEEITSALDTLVRYTVLLNNKVVDEEDGKLVFKKIIPADELLYVCSPPVILLPGDEELESFNITKIHKMILISRYHVHAGPEFIFRISLEELREELEKYEMSEEDFVEVITSVISKHSVVEYLIYLIKRTKAETIEDLIRAKDEITDREIDGPRSLERFDIPNNDYVRQVIEDLKKLEIIRLKGNKIKLNL
jgi:hypothetical protein